MVYGIAGRKNVTGRLKQRTARVKARVKGEGEGRWCRELQKKWGGENLGGMTGKASLGEEAGRIGRLVRPRQSE